MESVNWADIVEEDDDLQILHEQVDEVSITPKATSVPEPKEKVSRYTPESGPFRAFVGNLPFSAHENDVGMFFQDHGCSVKQVDFVYDRDSSQFRGFCYMEFSDRESLNKALDLNNKECVTCIVIHEPFFECRSCLNQRKKMYFTFVHCFLIFVDLTCFGFLAYERGGFEKVGVRAPKKDDSKFGGSFRSGGRSFQSDRYSDKDRDFLNFRSRGNVSSPPRKTSEPVKEVKPTEPAKEVSTEDADSNKPVLSLKEQLASRPKVKLDPSKPKVDPFAGAKPREIVLEKRGVPDKVSAQPSSEKTEEKDVVTDQNSVKGKERSRVNSQGNSRGDWRGNAKEKSKVQPRRAPKAKVVEEAKVPIKSQNAFDLLAELDNE